MFALLMTGRLLIREIVGDASSSGLVLVICIIDLLRRDLATVVDSRALAGPAEPGAIESR